MSFTINTRKCNKSDYAFVFGLVKESIFPLIRKFFVPDKKMFDERFYSDYKERTILLMGKEKIGFYYIKKKKAVLYINGIFLVKKYRYKGLGSFLMKYFETLGCKKIQLEVWENNPALKFYKKLGYKAVKKNQHKYVMEKRIVKK